MTSTDSTSGARSRLPHADVVRDPDGARTKVLQVYRARQLQLRAG